MYLEKHRPPWVSDSSGARSTERQPATSGASDGSGTGLPVQDPAPFLVTGPVMRTPLARSHIRARNFG